MVSLPTLTATLVPKDTSSITVDVKVGATKLPQVADVECPPRPTVGTIGIVGGGRGFPLSIPCFCCTFMPFAREGGVNPWEIWIP